MKLTTKQLTLCAMLTAMALALSYLENFFPLSLAIPIPGIKLGLANIVTVFALYALGPVQALLILLSRCVLGAGFAGNMNALLFSLLGGVTAMLVMILLSRSRRLSVYGVSVGGAAAHNCGQVAAAILKHTATNGLRARRCVKYFLAPRTEHAETRWGSVRVKRAEGLGIVHAKPEYDDVAAVAREHGLSFEAVWKEVLSQL